MEPRRIVRDGVLHQAARFDVCAVAGLRSGYEHPVIEGAGIFLNAGFEDAQAVRGEVRVEFLAGEGARVGRVANHFDAIVELGDLRIIGHEDIENAHAPAAPYHARHFSNRARRVGKMVQAVTGGGDIERAIGERQGLRVTDGEIEIGEPFGRRGPPRALENRGREIESANPADVPRESQRERAGAAGEVQARSVLVARTIRASRSASATRLATA